MPGSTNRLLTGKRLARAFGPTKPSPELGRLPYLRVHIPKDALDLLVGQLLSGRYYVLSVLGYGGMSVVYKSKDRSTKKILAIKTLRMQGLSDELTVKRFQREAETLTYLHHPNIVQIYDYGTTRLGQPFFVMDYYTGIDLAHLLIECQHLDVDRFGRIFFQVIDAIDHAHSKTLIHRDLKPGNIMLIDSRDGREFIKVVDFGIAKFEEEAQRLTRMGEVWGSPIYMSPEQCMGAPIDARSDVYSLGIVMYEALLGRVPFWGKNYVETMKMQIGEPPPAFRDLRPDLQISAKLEAVIMKAIQKDPDKRYQSISDLRKDLEKILGTQKVKTRPPTSEESKPQGVVVNPDDVMRITGEKVRSLPPGAYSTGETSRPDEARSVGERARSQEMRRPSGEYGRTTIDARELEPDTVVAARSSPSQELRMSRTRMLDSDRLHDGRQSRRESDSPWVKPLIVFCIIAGVIFGVVEGMRWYMQVKAPPVVPPGLQQIPDSIPDSDLIPADQFTPGLGDSGTAGTEPVPKKQSKGTQINQNKSPQGNQNKTPKTAKPGTSSAGAHEKGSR